ncbi:hypothetical protein BDN72DRAFT_849164 [Pluteus cervinus]|uniref:Uncharacterized protein n=1 Tax=Pluteus cervinus TaxID=181527 RepID=A0ACD3A9A0_9AGAR|nr:hypothetical protein BDN72DRAFT_849164 [Pluteus cervinus]
MQPRLPPELERLIFIYALRDSIQVQLATHLFLVAKRVREWLLPLAFEVVHFGGNWTFPITFTPHHFEAYGLYIHDLLVDFEKEPNGHDRLVRYLGLCPNLANLAVWQLPRPPPDRLDYLLQLPKLTHLTIDVIGLLYLTSPIIVGNQGTLISSQTHAPLFPHITHLNTIYVTRNILDSDDDIIALSRHFPNLTHVSFTNPSDRHSTALRLALERWDRLEVLLLKFLWGHRGVEDPLKDQRVMLISMHNLDDWAVAALNIWELADEQGRTAL